MVWHRNIFALFLILFVIGNLNAEEGGKSGQKDDQTLRYKRPEIADLAFFAEPFHSQEEFESRWIKSEAKKDDVDEAIAKYDGIWEVTEPKENPIQGDHGLVLVSQAKHAAIASSLLKPFRFEDQPLIVQYEVRFQNKHECGGAYVKLLTEEVDLKEFNDKSPYTIMFGPDKCGSDNKLHFIFQHENPVSHKMEEKHAEKPKTDFSGIFDDNKTHLLTLIVRPDNSYEIQVDKSRVSEGSLLKDMTPPVNPPKEIDDPEDKKPEEWDEREKIPDPNASKPDDWDEDAPKMITDANAKKPDGWLDDESDLIPDPAAICPPDWDDEEDGEWEAPQISNPKCKPVGCGQWKAPIIKNPNYKGKWSPAMIANPKYKGIWKPKRIENPDYFEDTNPFAMKSIGAVGFELWSMQADILFDNVIISNDLSAVAQWTAQTWDLKQAKEAGPGAVSGMLKTFMDATEEKPWLWGVVVAAILLPTLLLFFCCKSSDKKDAAAVHKKTDDVQSDDEEETQKSDDEGAKVKEVIEKEEINEVNAEKEEEKEEDSEELAATNSQEEKDEDVAPEPEASPSPRTRSRRKTRKDN